MTWKMELQNHHITESTTATTTAIPTTVVTTVATTLSSIMTTTTTIPKSTGHLANTTNVGKVFGDSDNNFGKKLTEEQILLIVIISAVLVVVFFAVGFCLLFRRGKLKDSLIRNKPIMVKMFNKNTERRRNAVTEETFQSRATADDIEVPPSPNPPEKKKMSAIAEVEEEADVQIEIEESPEEEENDEEKVDENYGTLNKNVSKSLPELNKVDNTKRHSALLDPVYLVATAKGQQPQKRTTLQTPGTRSPHSLPKNTIYNENNEIGISRYNTIQNPQIFIHSLKESRNNEFLTSHSPVARFHSLHNVNHFHTELPRATSVERIPIDNARKFKDCKLTEISPGCFSVPIEDGRRNKEKEDEMKVYY